VSKQPSKRPVIFGEVLFDRFPDGSAVLGGAPFNVAWNLQAFGQAPLLVSRVGDDALGEQIRNVMTDWSLDTRYLQTDVSHPTGSVNVSFSGGEPSYDIVAASAWDFLEPADLPAPDEASLFYHGSLALRSTVARQTFRSLVRQLRVPRFVDVNLRAPWWQRQEVLDIITDATWVKLNEHELALLGVAGQSDKAASEALRQRYGLQGLIVTRGSQGAELLGSDERIYVAPEKAMRVVDTVGAGDAFASVILLGLLQQWPLQISLERAQAFASAVVGLRGATIPDKRFYAGFAKIWSLDSGEV
jgi:fructokinase